MIPIDEAQVQLPDLIDAVSQSHLPVALWHGSLTR